MNLKIETFWTLASLLPSYVPLAKTSSLRLHFFICKWVERVSLSVCVYLRVNSILQQAACECVSTSPEHPSWNYKSPFLFSQLHSDIDSGDGNIKYILSGEGAGTIFVIDDKSGNIHATKTLDREERAQYTLMAQAVDRDTNRPLEPPSEFIVKVQDINDNPPEFLHETYHANVPERSNVGT